PRLYPSHHRYRSVFPPSLPLRPAPTGTPKPILPAKMPPNASSSILATNILPRVIHYHLDNYFYGNALFFAERLAAQDPKSPESTSLLALCHFRLEDFQTAFETAKPAAYKGVHLGCV